MPTNTNMTVPVDEEELDRLRLMHEVYLHLFSNTLTTIPLSTPTKILDIGTGSGDWAMSMGDAYPSAEIIGTDIAKIQPSAVPLNVFFEIDDAEEAGGWTWEEDTFDMVHLRNMAGSFRDWKHVYRETYRHLKPGGYIEVIDYDNHEAFFSVYGRDSQFAHVLHELGEASRKAGRPRGCQHVAASLLAELGFTDVHIEDVHIPCGIWPDEREERNIGKMAFIAMISGIESYFLRLLTEEMGWSRERVLETVEKVQRELQAVAMDPMRGQGLSFRVLVMVGRKPGGVGDGDGKEVR